MGPTSRGFAALPVCDLASRPSALGSMGRFVDRRSSMPVGLERAGEAIEACRVAEATSCQRVVACPRFAFISFRQSPVGTSTQAACSEQSNQILQGPELECFPQYEYHQHKALYRLVNATTQKHCP